MGGCENVRIRTSLICGGGHQSRWPPLHATAVVALREAECCVTLDVHMQLNEDDSSGSYDDDDDMPQLSPVTDISASFSSRPSYTVVASSSVSSGHSAVPQSPRDGKSARSKSSAVDGHTRLHCICQTPYDQTKYVAASLVSDGVHELTDCYNF